MGEVRPAPVAGIDYADVGKRLISYVDALRIVIEAAPNPRPETVPLAEALGRMLLEAPRSQSDLPPFDNSAVDGYAIAREDVASGTSDRPLVIVGEIAAGSPALFALRPGECVRVFTGAPVPLGTGAVGMQEDAFVMRENLVTFARTPELGENVRVRACELKAGDVVVEPGIVTPPVMGALAAAGIERISVAAKPRVALVVTGDELIESGANLQPGQIYESNGLAISAALHKLGSPPRATKQCSDRLDDVEKALDKALEEADVVITTGGVSVGDHDVVRPALRRLGIETRFWGVAIKPGKPVFFGERVADRKFVFGLPGNPVSALVTFFLLVRPFLVGCAPGDRRLRARLQLSLSKKAGRMEFVPAKLSSGGVEPFAGRASHKASILAQADCLVILEEEVEGVEAGAEVEVVMLDW